MYQLSKGNHVLQYLINNMCDDDDDDNDDDLVLTWLARTSVCVFFGPISPNFNLKNMISTYKNYLS